MDEALKGLDGELTAAEIEAMGDGLYDGWDDDPDLSDAEDEDDGEQENGGDDDGEETPDREDGDGEEEAGGGDETGGEDEDGEDGTETAEHEEPGRKTWTLKHLDETKEVDEAEMTVLAQKGLDYDRIRADRDEMKSQWAELQSYKKFMDELVANSSFDNASDLMDDTRATMKVKIEKDRGNTITKANALADIKKARESEKAEAEKAKPENGEDAEKQRREAEINAFFETFEDRSKVPAFKDLPVEVVSEWEKTGRLIAPYYRWLAKKAETEAKTLKQNQKNREKSTGSRQTKGKGTVKDPLFDGWED